MEPVTRQEINEAFDRCEGLCCCSDPDPTKVYHCTRSAGHSGSHVATGFIHVYAIWTDADVTE